MRRTGKSATGEGLHAVILSICVRTIHVRAEGRSGRRRHCARADRAGVRGGGEDGNLATAYALRVPNENKTLSSRTSRRVARTLQPQSVAPGATCKIRPSAAAVRKNTYQVSVVITFSRVCTARVSRREKYSRSYRPPTCPPPPPVVAIFERVRHTRCDDRLRPYHMAAAPARAYRSLRFPIKNKRKRPSCGVRDQVFIRWTDHRTS